MPGLSLGHPMSHSCTVYAFGVLLSVINNNIRYAIHLAYLGNSLNCYTGRMLQNLRLKTPIGTGTYVVVISP